LPRITPISEQHPTASSLEIKLAQSKTAALRGVFSAGLAAIASVQLVLLVPIWHAGAEGES